MSGYEAAVMMSHREHDRWNQWALFFFGSIVSVFIVWSYVDHVIPIWGPFLAGFVLSLMWTAVALSIRASTRAWFETVKRLEQTGGDGNPFHAFEEELGRQRRLADLRRTLALWRSEPYKRVTRILTLLGVLAAALFLALAVLDIGGWVPSVCPPVD